MNELTQRALAAALAVMREDSPGEGAIDLCEQALAASAQETSGAADFIDQLDELWESCSAEADGSPDEIDIEANYHSVAIKATAERFAALHATTLAPSSEKALREALREALETIAGMSSSGSGMPDNICRGLVNQTAINALAQAESKEPEHNSIIKAHHAVDQMLKREGKK
jgi:hypothetical protein